MRRPFSVMSCICFSVVVYPSPLPSASWTSRTVLGPTRQSTARMSSSAPVGRGVFVRRREAMTEAYYDQNRMSTIFIVYEPDAPDERLEGRPRPLRGAFSYMLSAEMDRMKRPLVFAFFLLWAGDGAAQSLVLTNARILDGKGGAIERGSVVVRDGTIVSAAAGTATAQGARVIDVKGMTVMPGFIDSHRHPIGQGAEWLKTEAPARMQEFLDAGFTTVLSAGDDINTAIPLRDQIAKGSIKGPRLIVLGRAPTAGAPAPPAGRGRGDAPPAAAPPAGRGRGDAPPAARGGGGGFGGRGDPARNVALRTPATTAATAVPPEQTRATVETLAKAGVDGFKTVLQVTPGGPEVATQTLIVQEAKKFNLPVMTHAVSVDRKSVV